MLRRDDGHSPIRLVLGPADQVQLDLSAAAADLVITNLTRAVDEISERPTRHTTGAGTAASPTASSGAASSGAALSAAGGGLGTGGRLPGGDGPAPLDGRGEEQA